MARTTVGTDRSPGLNLLAEEDLSRCVHVFKMYSFIGDHTQGMHEPLMLLAA
eukprot:COSAG02_NODE_370_length_23672_cov_318.104738_2_plen_52_part_00